MQNCETACNKFQAQLDRWMRHSKGDKMFWMDRWKVGLFGEDRTQALRSQLGDCKAILSVALSTGTYIQQAKAETNEQEKSDMLETQQDGLMRKIQRAEREYDALELNFQQVSVNVYTQINNTQPEPEVDESRQELILELQRQMASKDNLKKAFEESLADFHEELTGARVTRTHASDHGRAYAGFIGGNPKDFKGKLDVSDTTATSHGFAAAGVVNGVHFPKD